MSQVPVRQQNNGINPLKKRNNHNVDGEHNVGKWGLLRRWENRISGETPTTRKGSSTREGYS